MDQQINMAAYDSALIGGMLGDAKKHLTAGEIEMAIDSLFKAEQQCAATRKSIELIRTELKSKRS